MPASGSWELVDTLNRLNVTWSITVSMNTSVRTAITAIDEADWVDIVYPDGGHAQVADTTYVTGGYDRKRPQHQVRLVVRRTRLNDPDQAQLWPDWRYHAFITNLEHPVVAVDQFHRQHATIELAIRDLKDGAGLEHCPSGRFFATPPGSAAPCSPTTSAAGPPASAVSTPTPADRHRHHPQPAVRPARPARQPQQTIDPASPRPMAMGDHLPHRAGPDPRPTTIT